MITNLKDLCVDIEEKRIGKKVVLATGTFDLFHYNHLKYLEDAKKCGDILVVAVKDNKGANLKGRGRPIIDEFYRMAIIDAIKWVDYTFLAEYNPNKAIQCLAENQKQEEWLKLFEVVFESLKPDILFHEYNEVLQTARDKASEKYGFTCVWKPRGIYGGLSTTGIIKRIIELDERK